MSSIKAKISCDPIIRRNPIVAEASRYHRQVAALERRAFVWSVIIGGLLGVLAPFALIGLVCFLKLRGL